MRIDKINKIKPFFPKGELIYFTKKKKKLNILQSFGIPFKSIIFVARFKMPLLLIDLLVRLNDVLHFIQNNY